MKNIYLGSAFILLAVVVHFSLFEWKVGSTHYSLYRSDVRHLHSEDRNNLLYVQLGTSTYSSDPRYEGYKRGYGIFFRDFIVTPQLQTIAVFFGVIGPLGLIMVALYLFVFGRKGA